MTTRKCNKKHKNKEYTNKEIDDATEVIGDLMNQASSEIWDVLMSYKFTPGCIYGILETIKLTISNDVNSVSIDDPYICGDCHDKLVEQEKSSPKKTKEATQAMYG